MKRFLFALLMFTALATSANAETYQLELPSGLDVTGFIQTDDTIGWLNASNVANYQFTWTLPLQWTNITLTPSNSSLFQFTGIYASSTALGCPYGCSIVVPGNPYYGNGAYGQLQINSNAMYASLSYPGGTLSGLVPGEGIGIATAVPEPSTWALMLIGFAGLGFAFRRSRRNAAFA